jgi:hypothetical protein
MPTKDVAGAVQDLIAVGRIPHFGSLALQAGLPLANSASCGQ